MNRAERQPHLEQLRRFPADLAAAVQGLTPQQIDTVSIEGGWSVRQIVHHLADSHMNSVIRCKLILTMERPPLQGYPQEAWAELTDVYQTPIEESLAILKGLHARWVALLEVLPDAAWSRTGLHSENGEVSLDEMLVAYSQHCRDHLDQIGRVVAAQDGAAAG